MAGMAHKRSQTKHLRRGVAEWREEWMDAPLTDTQLCRMVQYYAEGRTLQQIGDAAGVSHQAVSRSIQRARANLAAAGLSTPASPETGSRAEARRVAPSNSQLRL